MGLRAARRDADRDLLMKGMEQPMGGTAALLQLPYLIWTAFAGYLNLTTWLLNR